MAKMVTNMKRTIYKTLLYTCTLAGVALLSVCCASRGVKTTPNYHKIPLMFYGEVIKSEFRGMKIPRVSNQSDLASTLMHQLNLDASDFPWSRNLFNPYSPEFAYFSFEEGLGWIRPPAGHFAYDARVNHFNEISIPESMQDSIIKEGKSYLQVLFGQYMSY